MAENIGAELIKIDRHYFWHIIDELCDDNSIFIYSRSEILKALMNGNLYGLKMDKNNPHYNRETICQHSDCLLPCFCIAENSNAILLWVHSRARRKGFGRLMVKLLDIKSVYCPLDDACEFWQKCGINT